MANRMRIPVRRETQRAAQSRPSPRIPSARRAIDEAAGSPAPSSIEDTLQSSGRPLDACTRAFMEPRFGRDFSSVRVHSGPIAERSAQDVNAHAYTVGKNIVFAAGQFAPGTQEGRRLLAHELAH